MGRAHGPAPLARRNKAKFDGDRLTFEVKLGRQSTWVLAYDLKLEAGDLAGRLVSKQGPVVGGRLNELHARKVMPRAWIR